VTFKKDLIQLEDIIESSERLILLEGFVSNLMKCQFRRNTTWNALMVESGEFEDYIWPPLFGTFSVIDKYLHETKKILKCDVNDPINRIYTDSKVEIYLRPVNWAINTLNDGMMRRSESQFQPPVNFPSFSLNPIGGLSKIYTVAEDLIEEYASRLKIKYINTHKIYVVFGPYYKFTVDPEFRIIMLPLEELYKARFYGTYLAHEVGHIKFSEDIWELQKYLVKHDSLTIKTPDQEEDMIISLSDTEKKILHKLLIKDINYKIIYAIYELNLLIERKTNVRSITTDSNQECCQHYEIVCEDNIKKTIDDIIDLLTEWFELKIVADNDFNNFFLNKELIHFIDEIIITHVIELIKIGIEGYLSKTEFDTFKIEMIIRLVYYDVFDPSEMDLEKSIDKSKLMSCFRKSNDAENFIEEIKKQEEYKNIYELISAIIPEEAEEIFKHRFKNIKEYSFCRPFFSDIHKISQIWTSLRKHEQIKESFSIKVKTRNEDRYPVEIAKRIFSSFSDIESFYDIEIRKEYRSDYFKTLLFCRSRDIWENLKDDFEDFVEIVIPVNEYFANTYGLYLMGETYTICLLEEGLDLDLYEDWIDVFHKTIPEMIASGETEVNEYLENYWNKENNKLDTDFQTILSAAAVDKSINQSILNDLKELLNRYVNIKILGSFYNNAFDINSEICEILKKIGEHTLDIPLKELTRRQIENLETTNLDLINEITSLLLFYENKKLNPTLKSLIRLLRNFQSIERLSKNGRLELVKKLDKNEPLELNYIPIEILKAYWQIHLSNIFKCIYFSNPLHNYLIDTEKITDEMIFTLWRERTTNRINSLYGFGVHNG